MQFPRLGYFLLAAVPHPYSAKADSHVPESNFSQQDQADGVSLRRVAVVGTLRHHVCEVDSLPKHVACLEEEGQVKTSSQDSPVSSPPLVLLVLRMRLSQVIIFLESPSQNKVGGGREE